MVRKQEQSVEVFTFPIIFHMEWVDSNHISWTPYCHFLAGNPAIFSLHTQYGVHMEWTISWTFHVDSMELPMNFTLQIHVLFHQDSVEESTLDKHIKCIVKNSANIKNQTLHSTRCHMHTYDQIHFLYDLYLNDFNLNSLKFSSFCFIQLLDIEISSRKICSPSINVWYGSYNLQLSQ